MATVNSTKAAASVVTRTQFEGVCSVVATYAIPASGNGTVAADVIQMVKVPYNATILDVKLTSTDIDSNGSPTHKFDVGDGGAAARFISASTVGQAGGIARLGDGVAAAATNGLFYTYPADDTIDVTVNTVSATKAAGAITLCVLYTMED